MYVITIFVGRSYLYVSNDYIGMHKGVGASVSQMGTISKSTKIHVLLQFI